LTLGVISVSGGSRRYERIEHRCPSGGHDSPKPVYRAGRGDRHDRAGDEVIEDSAIAASVA
jgi:predicted ABC-type ATPase